MENVYKFAGIPVLVRYRGKYFGEVCSDYLSEEEPIFEVLATDDDLQYEREHAEENIEYSKSYLEHTAVYRKFCEKAIDYNVVLCHGSVLEYGGDAFYLQHQVVQENPLTQGCGENILVTKSL